MSECWYVIATLYTSNHAITFHTKDPFKISIGFVFCLSVCSSLCLFILRHKFCSSYFQLAFLYYLEYLYRTNIIRIYFFLMPKEDEYNIISFFPMPIYNGRKLYWDFPSSKTECNKVLNYTIFKGRSKHMS